MSIDLQAREIQPLRQTFGRVAAYTGDKPASRYLEATLGAQPTVNFHYRPTWEPRFDLFDTGRSAVQMADWYALRDPRQYYYATWTMTRARQQEAMEANYQFVESRGLVDKMSDALRAAACEVLMPLRHVAWGGNMNNCSICSRGYGTAFTAPAMFHAMDHLGVAQYLTRLRLTLEEPGALEAGEVPARGGRIDAEERREGRGREGSALGDELQCFCLLRSDVTGARALTSNAAETTCNGKKGAREPVLVGHGRPLYSTSLALASSLELSRSTTSQFFR